MTLPAPGSTISFADFNTDCGIPASTSIDMITAAQRFGLTYSTTPGTNPTGMDEFWSKNCNGGTPAPTTPAPTTPAPTTPAPTTPAPTYAALIAYAGFSPETACAGDECQPTSSQFNFESFGYTLCFANNLQVKVAERTRFQNCITSLTNTEVYISVGSDVRLYKTSNTNYYDLVAQLPCTGCPTPAPTPSPTTPAPTTPSPTPAPTTPAPTTPQPTLGTPSPTPSPTPTPVDFNIGFTCTSGTTATVSISNYTGGTGAPYYGSGTWYTTQPAAGSGAITSLGTPPASRDYAGLTASGTGNIYWIKVCSSDQATCTIKSVTAFCTPAPTPAPTTPSPTPSPTPGAPTPPAVSYNCSGPPDYICSDPGDGSGAYSTLAECQTFCNTN